LKLPGLENKGMEWTLTQNFLPKFIFTIFKIALKIEFKKIINNIGYFLLNTT